MTSKATYRATEIRMLGKVIAAQEAEKPYQGDTETLRALTTKGFVRPQKITSSIPGLPPIFVWRVTKEGREWYRINQLAELQSRKA